MFYSMFNFFNMDIVTGYAETHNNRRSTEVPNSSQDLLKFYMAQVQHLTKELERCKNNQTIKSIEIQIFDKTGRHVETIDKACVVIREKEGQYLDVQIYELNN